ncbi:MAG TPA: methyltransferase domain-containing protein [Actinomycetota bacterium]|nr:methyltransferase domain-containing protein [Actinomycetota bacterium]
MGETPEHIARNRARWNDTADEYQERNAPQITEQMRSGDLAWGVWGIPESELHVLGDVDGLDVLELGCGAAQWSIALARRGARPVGLDLSDAQLAHARRLRADAGVDVPLVQASAEQVPFADGSFDVVFADHGAFTFADPRRTIPESARVLRSGGLLAFNRAHPILEIAWSMQEDHATERLVYDYFDTFRLEDPDGIVGFTLPFGEWIRLFTENDLVVESLIEPRPAPGTRSTYRDEVDLEWSRKWPAETIWRCRKR